MSEEDKPIVWLHGEVKTPPFTPATRLEVGLLLRRLQQGENIGVPHSRPMPSIGRRCHELRVRDENKNWRVMIRIDDDAILIAEVFPKNHAGDAEKRHRQLPAPPLQIRRRRGGKTP